MAAFVEAAESVIGRYGKPPTPQGWPECGRWQLIWHMKMNRSEIGKEKPRCANRPKWMEPARFLSGGRVEVTEPNQCPACYSKKRKIRRKLSWLSGIMKCEHPWHTPAPQPAFGHGSLCNSYAGGACDCGFGGAPTQVREEGAAAKDWEWWFDLGPSHRLELIRRMRALESTKD